MTTREPTGGREHDGAGDTPSLSDEVWEKFVVDTEHAMRESAPQEPSARARMVTARLRELDEQAARQGGAKVPWRFGRKAKKARPNAAGYTFVYPVTKADPDATEVTRTIVCRVLDLELSDPARYQVTPGKLAILRFDHSIGNSACYVYDGYLHPQFTYDTPTGSPATGSAMDPYDRSHDLDPGQPAECGTVTRT